MKNLKQLGWYLGVTEGQGMTEVRETLSAFLSCEKMDYVMS